MAATGGGSQGANRFGFGAAGAPSPTPFLGVGDSPAAQKSAPDGDGATTMETEGSEGGTPARSNRGSAVDAPPGLDRADVFSLGATAYELARGAALPSGGEAYQALRRGEMDPLDARSFGAAFRAVVAGMLRENPAARPSAAEVKAEVLRAAAAAPGGGDPGDGVAGIAGGSSVIGLFSPAVPESTQKEPIAGRGGGSGAGRAPSPRPRAPELRSFAGTPSRLGFQGEPAADEGVTDG
jgi:wee1-like protein kinase